MLDFIAIPIITAICYGVVEVIKSVFTTNENVKRFLPIISTTLGIVLSVITFYIYPDMIFADNLLYAVLAGMCSGLSATGGHQAIKQILKFAEKNGKDEY